MQPNDLPYADLTLSEALLQFRADNGLAGKYDAMSLEAQTHFERHDIIHVLFGLNTSLREEAQADGWTLIASDIGWNDIRTFMKLPEEHDLLAEVGWWALVKGFALSVPDYAKIIWRSRRLSKKWRWSDNAQYRQRSVSDIREEFGISKALAA
ncbi:MAG: hypothetical protein AAGL10_12735 [Pseudomonadota bacterium]